ncbi:MAG: hypothetical protein GTO45_41130 [Candidatus Aminicenantes bacterium]|nr:hypothetical protein [Candidatus Aminicenantes bacterium]NIM85009.1 hypothetical protein [Candidatus Aminicenantes bacterium]NIN24523.1 hypothetical protein [Candidatus Aminicenantes bacterium]NIN48287.1 hypothetical protein [Candidatus Aminicenantes bacterium]NIN91190.1 hypothetical protein [Candidatus Aminicenantes bacterium]
MKVENRTTRLVTLRLNSGQTLYIDPKSTSGEILDVDVRNNRKFNKLRERGVIAVHPAEKRYPPKRPKEEIPAPVKDKVELDSAEKDKKQIKSKGGK